MIRVRWRTLRTVALLLVGGAAANVAVAWGCAALIDATRVPLENSTYGFSNGTRWDLQEKHGFGVAVYVAMIANHTHESDSDGIDISPANLWPYWCNRSHRCRIEPGSDTPFESRMVDARGWPLISMWSERIRWCRFAQPVNDAVLGGIAIQKPIRPAGVFTVFEDLRVLPLRTVWQFFILNTIFYAAILWMMFGFPFVIRRRRRVRRGLCPACAYPIGTSDVCTECGGAVKTQKAESRA